MFACPYYARVHTTHTPIPLCVHNSQKEEILTIVLFSYATRSVLVACTDSGRLSYWPDEQEKVRVTERRRCVNRSM